MKSIIRCLFILLISGVIVSACEEVKTVKVMEVNEVTFHAQKKYENAYMEVDLWVDLMGPDGLSYRIPAFWDGGQDFRVRLVASKPIRVVRLRPLPGRKPKKRQTLTGEVSFVWHRTIELWNMPTAHRSSTRVTPGGRH